MQSIMYRYRFSRRPLRASGSLVNPAIYLAAPESDGDIASYVFSEWIPTDRTSPHWIDYVQVASILRTIAIYHKVVWLPEMRLATIGFEWRNSSKVSLLPGMPSQTACHEMLHCSQTPPWKGIQIGKVERRPNRFLHPPDRTSSLVSTKHTLQSPT